MIEKKQENRFYLHAFCPMDNHIHLMISEGTEDVTKAMLIEHGLKTNEENTQRTEVLIKEFRAKTNLSIRKIAVIVGLNKDKVYNILKG